VILWLLGVVLVGGAVVGAGLWYLQQQADADGDEAGDGEAEGADGDLQDRVAEVVAAAAAAIAGTPRKRARLRMAGAVVAVVGAFAVFAVVAGAVSGPLAALVFVGAVLLGASGPPAAILGLREAVPNLAATGLAIAAQIAFDRAALVRRDDGQYEWTVLRERAQGFLARLADGREVPIDADAGELYAFGFGKLAVTEQKTEANLQRWMVPEGTPDGGTETRAGIEVAPPQREHGGILVSLATIQRAVRGSASSTLVRRGRDKALDEEGGENGVSQLWTMAFATILLIVGFGMTFLALSL
jgi:hypothetical protein